MAGGVIVHYFSVHFYPGYGMRMGFRRKPLPLDQL